MAVMAALLLGSTVVGEELEISGFFDVTSTYQNSQSDQSDFGLGQAEIDLESQLSPTAAMAVAVAYNNESGQFELGCAEIALSLYSNNNTFVNSFDVAAGQFDVPFGIDYHVYHSIERKLVTSPMAVDLTHGGWNDYGVKFNMATQYFNVGVFGVNGFESSFEVSTAAQSLALGVAEGEEVNTTPANAFGTRVGVMPIDGLELGGSFAIGINESGKDEMLMAGVDMQYSISNVDLKGEYISHSLNRSIAGEKNQGYYFQSTYNMNRTFLVGRYGSFKPDGLKWYDRISLGGGYGVTDGVELRFETTINENSNNNTNILQMVVGF